VLVETSTLLVFSLAVLVLVITPGPDMLLIISRSVAQGPASGILSVLGFCAGNYIHATAAGLGLSGLFLTHPLAYDALRFAGASYLLWLAWKHLRSPAGSALTPTAVAPVSLPQVFRNALLTNVLNPKVALFFIALLPQFLDPSRGAILGQVLLLATVLNLIGATFNTGIALVAGRLGSWLSARPRFARAQQWMMVSVFTGLAIRLVVG
jgi:threonine/homoserine/homoserine lactone efflux protein